MSSSIEEALANCLDRMETGGATLEEALSLYPGLRAELEPLLSLSAELHAMPKVEAPARLRGYKRPVFRGPAAKARPRLGWRHRFLPMDAPSLGWATPLARVAAALAIVVAATSGTIVASASSLPDEPLYPVKLAVENAQLALAPSDQARADLELQFAAKRVAEVQSAAQQDKPVAVAQGAALYVEKVDAALKAAQAASPSTPAAPEKVQESVRQNVEVLQQVQAKMGSGDEKVGNDRAKAAIATAIARSEAASGEDRASRGKGEAASGKPAAEPLVTATPSPTPTTAAAPAAKPASSPTATPEPASGHEPPGKAKGRPEEPGNSGQGGSPAVKPEATVQPNGSDKRDDAANKGDGKPDKQQPRGQNAAVAPEAASQSQAPATPTATATPTAAPAATPTATLAATPAPPAAPTASPTAQPSAGGQGQEMEPGKGGQRDQKLSPGTDAAPGPDNGRSQGSGRGNGNKSEGTGKDSLNQDLLTTILHSIQNLVVAR